MPARGLRPSTKPAPKHDLIVSRLRSKIVRGQWAPGSQISNRVRLERQFEASTVTVQKALDELSRDGFVRAFGRRGTFVAPNPPHLFHYALAFEDRPDRAGRRWSRFNAALLDRALAIDGDDSPRRVRLYFDITGHGDVEDYQRLLADVRNDRLAGLIFVSLAPGIADTELFENPRLARICLNTAIEPGVTSLLADQAAFLGRALDDLKSRDRRRVAVVSAGLTEAFRHAFAAEVAARGMVSHPYWAQGPTYSTPDAVRNAVHLLLNPNQTERPEALIVADDHLVEDALIGVRAAGLRVPEDLAVVAHANFPFPPAAASSGARLLGFDVGAMLGAAIDLVDRHNRGKPLPKLERFAPVFEDEAAASRYVSV